MKNAIKLTIIVLAGAALFFTPMECIPNYECEHYTSIQTQQINIAIEDAIEIKTI